MRTTNKVGETEPQKRGRPPKAIDIEKLRSLAAIHCTDEEIASVLQISVDTLSRRKKEDPAVLEALEGGRNQGKASLRRLQWEAAKKGNAVMLIFLGKNILKQRDKFEDEGKVDSAEDAAERLRQALRAMVEVETTQAVTPRPAQNFSDSDEE